MQAMAQSADVRSVVLGMGGPTGALCDCILSERLLGRLDYLSRVYGQLDVFGEGMFA